MGTRLYDSNPRRLTNRRIFCNTRCVASYIIIMIESLVVHFSSLGLTFWKCPKRKVFAIRKGADSSDDDFAANEPRPKKMREKDLEGMSQSLDGVAANIEVMKEQIEEIRMCAADSKAQMPLALKTSLQENFKCRICHSLPIRPPVMIARCCRSILGCES